MLYRTHHLLFFHHFNHFNTTTTTPTTSHLLSPPPSLQVEQGMECVEGALKSSFRPEMAKKTHPQQALLDDLWSTVNTQNGVSGDDFFVDDLLDFSKDEFFEAEEETEHENGANPCTVSHFPLKEEKETEPEKKKDSDPCTELTIPAEDMADLEWLSHFVEDSFSEYSLTCPVSKLPVKPAGEPEIPVTKKSTFATPVQTKARSKRARTGYRVWSMGSTSLTESSSTTSSSSTSCSTQSNPWLIYGSPSQTAESFLGPPPPAAKRPKKRKQGPSVAGAGFPQQQQQPRRCSHCLVQKTPQWRAGPLGPKTLCNACGVRFKSGRLLPEYRPACSPTFSSEVHSNNHRKVLEMRRKKETDPELTQPVQSFESKILLVG